MISSYDKAVKIAKDENMVQPLDVNTIEIEKKIRINTEIFFHTSMYRMLSKIAFEWYCSKNSISGYYSEFNDIIKFITAGEGTNLVSIIQEEKIYEMLDQQVNPGSHTLFAIEKEHGEIDVIISLFGLLMYRVKVTNKRPDICKNNFLYTELRTDSSRNELVYHSYYEAEQKFAEILSPDNFISARVINGVTLMIPKVMGPIPNVELYPIWFNLAKYFVAVDDDINMPNDRLNKIFLTQLKNITQASTLQKKSIKRFVNETFHQGHEKIRLNPHTSNKKAVVLFYAVYLIGKSKEEILDDRILQKILREWLPNLNGESFIVDDEMENKLKQIMMADAKYSDVLEAGAEKIMNWQN